jgi:hypothetical protein
MNITIENKSITVTSVEAWNIAGGIYFQVNTKEKRHKLDISVRRGAATVRVHDGEGIHPCTVIKIQSDLIEIFSVASIVQGVDRWSSAFMITRVGDFIGEWK